MIEFYKEMIEELTDRLHFWEKRMVMGGWKISVEPIVEPQEGAWAFVEADEMTYAATLRVHPSLPEELIDWVAVHSLALLMMHSLETEVFAALADAPNEQRAYWRDRLGRARERVAQRITDAVLRRDPPFLATAWFAMLQVDD